MPIAPAASRHTASRYVTRYRRCSASSWRIRLTVTNVGHAAARGIED
jgi:hypothetical protein